MKQLEMLYMPNYRWEGFEEYLGHGLFATWLRVHPWWNLPNGEYVHGVVTIETLRKDQRSIDVFFHALSADGWAWKVREMGPKDPGINGNNWFTEPDRYPFTESSGANHAIKRFIAGRLAEFIATGREHAAVERKPGLRMQASTMYADCHGTCRHELGSLNLGPMARVLAKLGNPAHCYLCTCGRRWWQMIRGHRWVSVHSDYAWQMLIEHNGQAVRPVCLTPDGLVLLREKLAAEQALKPFTPYVWGNSDGDRILDLRVLRT